MVYAAGRGSCSGGAQAQKFMLPRNIQTRRGRMDQWNPTTSSANPKDFSQSLHQPSIPVHASSIPDSPRQRLEGEVKDPVAARKVQKADREKLRRDRLNEQFLELGHTLGPNALSSHNSGQCCPFPNPGQHPHEIQIDPRTTRRPFLTAEVNRLKTECAALSEESRELMQEKNELREEKASLKSDIENLNIQYHQRLGVMFPWAAVDPSVVMAPPYSYPVPVPVPTGTIPMHPSVQPFPFFGNQNPGAIPSPCSTFMPYPTPPNPPNEQPSSQYASSSHVSSKQDSESKSTDHPRGGNIERCDDSDDVATDLELKMPGSSAQQDVSSGERKGKQSQKKERNIATGSSSSRYSSSQGIQDSSSNSVGDVPKSDH